MSAEYRANITSALAQNFAYIEQLIMVECLQALQIAIARKMVREHLGWSHFASTSLLFPVRWRCGRRGGGARSGRCMSCRVYVCVQQERKRESGKTEMC